MSNSIEKAIMTLQVEIDIREEEIRKFKQAIECLELGLPKKETPKLPTFTEDQIPF